MSLIYPFITRVDFTDLRKRQVRLVHQLVKEFVIRDWSYLKGFDTSTASSQVIAPRIESLEAFMLDICIPWRRGPTTYIDATAKEARARHDEEHAKEDSLSIYTDGSGIEGEIGSAALCPLTQQVRSVHMGLDTVDSIRSRATRHQLSTADRTRVCEPKRYATRRRYIHRQPGRHLVHRQGGGTIRRLHPSGHRETGPGAPGQRTNSNRPMDTSPRGHTRERGRRQSGQGSHRMEGGWPQSAASRSASPAVHYTVDGEEMVQDTGRADMDSKVA
jgi:hypothetical protein